MKFSHTDRLEDDGPAAVAAHLHRVASIVADSAHVNGVHWMATDIVADGGKIILAAGAPTSSEDDEDRMLRTVRTIIEQATDLDLRVGVHCGPVFVGDLGSTRRRTFTIMGDAVNLAARLMGHAGPGEVIVSKALTDRARSRYELHQLEPFYVKGKSEPITAAMLGRLEGRDATLERHVLPLIGRRDELAVLDGFVARRAAEGRVRWSSWPVMPERARRDCSTRSDSVQRCRARRSSAVSTARRALLRAASAAADLVRLDVW